MTSEQKIIVGNIIIDLLEDNKLKIEEIGLVIRFAADLADEEMDEVDCLLIVKQSLRTIYSNMQNTPIVDLAFSLHYVSVLDDERKARKFLARLQDTIEMTNPTLLC